MKIDVKIGQRWLWNNPGNEILVEVLDVNSRMCKILYALGCNAHYHTKSQSVFSLSGSGWKYLKGQDKPQD
jgi:hypothetical protein